MILDLFCGAGGATTGLLSATNGAHVFGIEIDSDAVNSSRANGHDAMLADIRDVEPSKFSGSEIDHLHASPPCTTFSTAGTKAGQDHVAELCAAVKRVLVGEPHGLTDVDDMTLLVLEPARWIREIQPRSVSLEQVSAVFPIWKAYAQGLHEIGYHSWAEVLSSEQYGVPQTRLRAWLGASLDGPVAFPTPTHSRYYPHNPDRIDFLTERWLSMADALDWVGMAGFPRKADNDDIVTIDGEDYRARDFRPASQPALAVTEKARSWTHYAPAGVSQTSHPAAPRPIDGAPASAVTARATGYFYDSANQEFGQKLDSAHARRVTVEEVATLQGYPPGYIFTGTRTSQYRQVGNSVNPPVMEAVYNSLKGASQK